MGILFDAEFGSKPVEDGPVTKQLLDIGDRTTRGFLAAGVFDEEGRMDLLEPLAFPGVLLAQGDVVGQPSFQFANPILMG